jgi:hypothetical protein
MTVRVNPTHPSVLDGLNAFLELLLVLFGVFAANDDFDGSLATLEGLQIRGCIAPDVNLEPSEEDCLQQTFLLGRHNLEQVGCKDKERGRKLVA